MQISVVFFRVKVSYAVCCLIFGKAELVVMLHVFWLCYFYLICFMHDENFYLSLFTIFKYIHVLRTINAPRPICMLADLFAALSKTKAKENASVKEHLVEN